VALNKTRIGKADNHTLQLFNACRRPLQHDVSIKPTKMYPTRAQVEGENTQEFNALNTPIQTYSAIDSQSSPENFRQDLTYVLNDLQAPRELRLRVGAQVMLLANLNVTQGLVNGSRGVVTEFVALPEAVEYLQRQAILRGAGNDDESIAIGDLRAFTKGNEDILFPRVLFETKNTTKEVPPPQRRRWLTIGYYYTVYMDCAIGLAN
jgi:PIF1-like helicase